MGVVGTSVVLTPMDRPSRKNSTVPGLHSIVATCQYVETWSESNFSKRFQILDM